MGRGTPRRERTAGMPPTVPLLAEFPFTPGDLGALGSEAGLGPRDSECSPGCLAQVGPEEPRSVSTALPRTVREHGLGWAAGQAA